MKDWYYAVCDKCGEATHVMVNGPSMTATYLDCSNARIAAWLLKHSSCDLRLVHRDDQLDKLWAEGYMRADEAPAKFNPKQKRYDPPQEPIPSLVRVT